MLVDTELARKLIPLNHPDIKVALQELIVNLEAQAVNELKDTKGVVELRQLQGQLILLAELKQLEDRIKDGLKR